MKFVIKLALVMLISFVIRVAFFRPLKSSIEETKPMRKEEFERLMK